MPPPPSSQVEVLLRKLFQAAKQAPVQGSGDGDGDEREFLVLAEIAALQGTGKLPVAVNLMHVGVLYVLNGADRDREPGQFTFHDLCDFVERCEAEEKASSRGTQVPTFFRQTKEARCLLDMWEVATAEGVPAVTSWLMHVLRENGKALRGYRADSDSISTDTLNLLGRVLYMDDGWVADIARAHDVHDDPSKETWRRLADVAEYVNAFMAGWIDQLGRVGVTAAAEISFRSSR
ncbi:hypothetical protein H310_11782 [Aphanomyces invadans]|uniref:Uncharacterized protein n=1 Tax=Aphanomyces invadans TaxID=157072 RepID=A0A024TKA0_9STRA|nr:hypothetical protein H310_11782 [Aphanomyces invadans]ETV94453.1 hypothetical protein H310_11782 [Aphanomyces invadans]|eukprot:XP_008876768.1 hypothetical protein H310_11782 [Aphanomyces invadans]